MQQQQEQATRRPLFSLGHLVATPGALEAFAATGELITSYVAKHQCGEWGQLDRHDIRANEHALKVGARLLSAYHLKDDTKIWIITEADPSSTCVLLPEGAP
jgi:lipocalin